MDVRISFGDCERARQWISVGLDGELSGFEGVLLDGHLAACKACTAFLIETRSLTNELRNAPLEHFDARVAARRRPRIALRLSPAVASLAVVAVGIGSILASVRVGPFVGRATRRPPAVSDSFGAAPLKMGQIQVSRHAPSSAGHRPGPATRS